MKCTVSITPSSLTKGHHNQIETAARDGAFIYGTTYVTGEVAPATVDFMCEEILRVAGQVVYSSYAPRSAGAASDARR
jgi:hypothetical protein